MTRIKYIRLLTENFDDTLKFYRDSMELKMTHLNEKSNYAEFDLDGTMMSLFDRNYMASALGMEAKSRFHECADKQVIVLDVDDVDQVYENLRSKGIIFLAEPTDRPEWTVRTAHLRDPEGNIIEFNSALKSS
jgi:predicted enzyme related to lactoylglutathione lyase